MPIRHLLRAAVVAVAVASPAAAAEFAAFTDAAFAKAQAAGRPTLVHAHAGWCPICQKQQKIIGETTAAPAYRDTLVLTIDYDSQKDALKPFQISKQSTLIAFKGGKEQGRISYDASPEAVNRVVALAK